MDFEGLKKAWNGFGANDALWSNLTAPDAKGQAWDVADFLATGRDAVDRVFDDLERLGIPVTQGSALDFGCGAGRLSQALAARFERVVGVDVARSMIEQARRLDDGRCAFVVNETEDLRVFPAGEFDFVLSLIVLQHMEPDYAVGYIREFARVLRPGGVAVFQIPVAPAELPPADPARLPDAAYRAALTVELPQSPLAPDASAVVTVQVTNVSGERWQVPDRGMPALNVGNHWLDAQGAMLVRDDGRAPLPADLPPGGLASVALPVHTPGTAGEYYLAVDVVHEGVQWFADAGTGSERASVPVRLVSGAGTSWRDRLRKSRPTPTAADVMEMHYVPEERVRDTVTAAGGRVLEVEDDDSAGPEWVSRRFYCTRAT